MQEVQIRMDQLSWGDAAGACRSPAGLRDVSRICLTDGAAPARPDTTDSIARTLTLPANLT